MRIGDLFIYLFIIIYEVNVQFLATAAFIYRLDGRTEQKM